MAIFEDDKPKRKLAHELGQDLSLLSVGDLDERVELLRAEIMRLEADMVAKRAFKSAADSLFKIKSG